MSSLVATGADRPSLHSQTSVLQCTMLAGPEFEDLVHSTGCDFIPGNANFKELMTTNEELSEAFNSKV